MPKIIRILRSCSMKIFSTFPTVNISKLNFWLVICIAKNFIWTTLKVIFSIFRFFCSLRFQIYKYCPIITNHTSMESYLFSFQMIHKSQFRKIDTYDWFCGPGSHIMQTKTYFGCDWSFDSTNIKVWMLEGCEGASLASSFCDWWMSLFRIMGRVNLYLEPQPCPLNGFVSGQHLRKLIFFTVKTEMER